MKMNVDNICERLNSCCQWRNRRWFVLAFALLELFWFSGYYYGYNALIPIYKDLGVFAGQCEEFQETCKEQEGMFHKAFIVWLVTQMCLITGAGFLLDRVGLRALKLMAVVGYFVGTLMFAFTARETSGLFFVAGIFVSLSATSSLICSHQVSSMFPKFRGFVVSLLSGAFDSSGFVTFLISKTVVDIPLKTSFIILACCALIMGILMGLFGLKRWASEMNEDAPMTKTTEMVAREKGDISNSSLEQDVDLDAVLDTRIQRFLEHRYTSFWSCVKSWPFVLVTLWFMFALLRFSYFLTQMSQQLVYLFGDDEDTIKQLQSVSSALLMSGFLISPISGFILDSSRTYFRRITIRKHEGGHLLESEMYWLHLRGIAPAFLVLALCATTLSALNIVKAKATYYIAFILFVVLRSLLFSASVSFVLIAFPIQYFGTVNGLVNTIGGIFSLLQYAFAKAEAIPGNAMMTALSGLLYISPLILFFKRH